MSKEPEVMDPFMPKLSIFGYSACFLFSPDLQEAVEL